LRIQVVAMTLPETSRSKIIARLLKEGWTFENGAKHDKFAHPDRPGVKIMVPRHTTLTPGVARNIARAAGW
jgi:predicted RNA binding protein YcfA (HicA-like mRNA interferase family)